MDNFPLFFVFGLIFMVAVSLGTVYVALEVPMGQYLWPLPSCLSVLIVIFVYERLDRPIVQQREVASDRDQALNVYVALVEKTRGYAYVVLDEKKRNTVA
jgi:hypothetical protein